ncbi:hypothetical protein [Tenacibaculum maritimum]|uniref:hypothetical protein n=1 Tax=Tenacibaculum maritimum TaxID=107401 RepID=UPI0012E49F46|nr:hypothetical protein [Tenacibaculum maritimum]CAA0157818.1 hypothetical protein JIP4600_100070 [Tenacibaculum maritimum]CAA0171049.1 hypothetical protein TMFC_140054 [Tenacibaculum maritimum]CAA0206584.1 hypothetical protein TMP139_310053 [Tenacibaculum maritimum]
MKQIINKLREKTKDPEGDFASMLAFSETSVEKKYYMEFFYREQNTDGSFKQAPTSVKVSIAYCPFTGKELNK